jgi:ribosomal protein S1
VLVLVAVVVPVDVVIVENLRGGVILKESGFQGFLIRSVSGGGGDDGGQ